MEIQTNNNSSIGCGGVALLLTIVLLVLKVTGVLSISWLLVFLPVIISASLSIILIIILTIIFLSQ